MIKELRNYTQVKMASEKDIHSVNIGYNKKSDQLRVSFGPGFQIADDPDVMIEFLTEMLTAAKQVMPEQEVEGPIDISEASVEPVVVSQKVITAIATAGVLSNKLSICCAENKNEVRVIQRRVPTFEFDGVSTALKNMKDDATRELSSEIATYVIGKEIRDMLTPPENKGITK